MASSLEQDSLNGGSKMFAHQLMADDQHVLQVDRSLQQVKSHLQSIDDCTRAFRATTQQQLENLQAVLLSRIDHVEQTLASIDRNVQLSIPGQKAHLSGLSERGEFTCRDIRSEAATPHFEDGTVVRLDSFSSLDSKPRLLGTERLGTIVSLDQMVMELATSDVAGCGHPKAQLEDLGVSVIDERLYWLDRLEILLCKVQQTMYDKLSEIAVQSHKQNEHVDLEESDEEYSRPREGKIWSSCESNEWESDRFIRRSSVLVEPKLERQLPNETLRAWITAATESFSLSVFFRELIGQHLWYVFGPPLYPVLLRYYGSRAAIANRGMLPMPYGWKSYFFSLFFCFSPMVSCAIVIIYQAGTFWDVFVLFFSRFLWIMTISVKYAHLPKSQYKRLETRTWSSDQLSSLLLIETWFKIDLEFAYELAEMSFVTVCGIVREDLYLTFLHPSIPEQAQAICKLQGETTQFVVMNVLGYQTLSLRSNAPEDLPPLVSDLSRGADDADSPRVPSTSNESNSWPMTMIDGQPRAKLLPFFKEMLRVSLAEQKNSRRSRLSGYLNFFMGLSLGLSPCFGRLLDSSGETFLPTDALSLISFVLSMPCAVLFSIFHLTFLEVAARDMRIRRSLLRSISSLLSTHQDDRFRHVPRQLRQLGILDTRNPETVQAFRYLRELCKDWGKLYHMRIMRFIDGFAIATCLLIGCLIILIELKLYRLISRSLLLLAILLPLFLASYILQLVLLGEDVNAAAQRLSVLLQRHSTSLKEASVRVHDQELALSVKTINAAKTFIMDEQASKPVKLLGFRCGYSMITALYVIPVYLCLRIRDLCIDKPDLCFLSGAL